MSEWTPPTGPQSVEYRTPRAGLGALTGALPDLSRRIRALEGASPLRASGIRARPGHISSTDFDGTSRTALGTLGWMLGSNDDGPPYMVLAGRDVITDLDAKDVTILGLISDLTATQATLTTTVADLTAAQADIVALIGTQILPARFHTRTTGWSLGTTAAVKASVTLTTPAGFTRALVSLAATAGIVNSSAATVVFTVEPIVNGTAGEASYDLIAAGYGGKDSAPASELVTGLTGGATFTVQTSISTGGVAIATSATNVAVVDGTVLWLR